MKGADYVGSWAAVVVAVVVECGGSSCGENDQAIVDP